LYASELTVGSKLRLHQHLLIARIGILEPSSIKTTQCTDGMVEN